MTKFTSCWCFPHLKSTIPRECPGHTEVWHSVYLHLIIYITFQSLLESISVLFITKETWTVWHQVFMLLIQYLIIQTGRSDLSIWFFFTNSKSSWGGSNLSSIGLLAPKQPSIERRIRCESLTAFKSHLKAVLYRPAFLDDMLSLMATVSFEFPMLEM